MKRVSIQNQGSDRFSPSHISIRIGDSQKVSILVTGGAGYIGSHMVLGLLEKGERVVVIDNLSTGFSNAVPDGVRFGGRGYWK